MRGRGIVVAQGIGLSWRQTADDLAQFAIARRTVEIDGKAIFTAITILGIGRAGNAPTRHIILVQARGTRGEVTVDHEVEVTADQNIVDVDAVGSIAIGLVVFKDNLDLAVGGRGEGIT